MPLLTSLSGLRQVVNKLPSASLILTNDKCPFLVAKLDKKSLLIKDSKFKLSDFLSVLFFRKVSFSYVVFSCLRPYSSCLRLRNVCRLSFTLGRRNHDMLL